jgi:hypothetical protein
MPKASDAPNKADATLAFVSVCMTFPLVFMFPLNENSVVVQGGYVLALNQAEDQLIVFLFRTRRRALITIVGDRLKRIIDFVGNRTQEASYRNVLLARHQELFSLK